MMKLFSRISAGNLLQLLNVRGDFGNMFMAVAGLFLAKRLDGKGVVREERCRVDRLKRGAENDLRAWIGRHGGRVVNVDRGVIRAIFTNGFAEISACASSPSDGLTLSRRRRRRGSGKATPRYISLAMELVGEEKWVLKMVGMFKEHFQTFSAPPAAKRVVSRLHVLSVSRRGISLKAVAAFDEQLEVENYTDDVARKFSNAVKQISSKDPSGRLLIIHGPTGSGKTYMTRALINTVRNVRCVMVPSQYVPHFTDPTFGNMLIRQRKPTCLIIEDADMLLVDRMSDNMVAITTMLNLADGMFGAIADVRIVCTTNAKKLSMEPALLRAGRLLDQIYVDDLTPAHASRIYKRLTEQDREFTKATSLAQVYALARG